MTIIVYGARCTWWDSIDKTARLESGTGHGIPCCPHCRSVLFQVDNIEIWNKGADKYEADGHPGYRKMLDWIRGKCFPSMKAAEEAYLKEGHSP